MIGELVGESVGVFVIKLVGVEVYKVPGGVGVLVGLTIVMTAPEIGKPLKPTAWPLVPEAPETLN